MFSDEPGRFPAAAREERGIVEKGGDAVGEFPWPLYDAARAGFGEPEGLPRVVDARAEEDGQAEDRRLHHVVDAGGE